MEYCTPVAENVRVRLTARYRVLMSIEARLAMPPATCIPEIYGIW